MVFLEATFEKKEFYRSTIPHTLLLFSVIDIIGFLLGSENNPADTSGNFNTFFNHFFHKMLSKGVYLPPSAFESWFLNDALSYKDLDDTIQAAKESMSELLN